MEVDTDSVEIRGDRSLEDVLSVLEYAKLEASDLRSQSQCILFSQHLDNDHIKLMELDSSVLNSLTAGDRVVIRGDKDESAVLCTQNKTFEIKEAETSNSLLILPKLEYGPDLPSDTTHEIHYTEVVSVLDKYFELRPCKPRLKKLKALMSQNQYSGRECEADDDHQGKKYTYSDLLECIQASEDEIMTALKHLKACIIDGYWRILDFDFLMQVLNHVLQLCDENDWLTTGVDMKECCDTLQELFPRNVVEHVVKCYTDVKTVEDGSKEVYKLNEDKICRFFAELTLRNAGKFHYQEFLQVWQQSVPEGMSTSLYQIEGMALIEQEAVPPVIWYFTVDDLPEDTADSDLTTEKMDVGALLTKYARASLQNGVKVFSSRKTTS